jgi:hypothetical protein
MERKEMIENKIRLSYSALNDLHTCERLFQLDRLLVTDFEKQEYPATVLGKAFGTFVQQYLCYQDFDWAVFNGWLSYYPILEDNQRSEEIYFNLCVGSVPTLDNLLQDWEVLTVKRSKYAMELSYCLDIDQSFYFVGYVDLVLQNRWNGRSAVMEIKTTSLKLHDLSPVYQNSGQALGYSIILDQIVGSEQAEYDVLYFVAQLGSGNGFSPNFSLLNFPKTLQDRLNWFITLQLDTEHLHTLLDHNIFPLRGQNCLQYMRPCKHFGTCTFQLEEVIQNHIERI